MKEALKVFTGTVMRTRHNVNAYDIKIDVSQSERDRMETDRFYGIPISHFSDTASGSGFFPTYEVNDEVVFIANVVETSTKIEVPDNTVYIIGSIGQEGRLPSFEGQFQMSSGKGSSIVFEDQYPTSGVDGDLTITGRRTGMLSGEGYSQWSTQQNVDQIWEDEATYAEGQIKPVVPNSGLFLSRDTGEKIWMNSGSIVMTAYGFNIIASGSLSGGDTTTPTWDIAEATSGSITIADANGNYITLNEDGINIEQENTDVVIDAKGNIILTTDNGNIQLNGNANIVVADGDKMDFKAMGTPFTINNAKITVISHTTPTSMGGMIMAGDTIAGTLQGLATMEIKNATLSLQSQNRKVKTS